MHPTPTTNSSGAAGGLGTVLGFWAHPDDEAYLSAGLMALARDSGQRVVVVTATAGEKGTSDPSLFGSPTLARLRRRELAASLRCLGVDEHHVLGLPDGGCDQLHDAEGAAVVSAWIDAVAPDTIVTFGPEGLTGHADHLAVHRWTTRAWERGGRRERLLYATVTPEFHDRWGPVNEEIGLWEGEVPCTPVDQLALAVDCQPVLYRKVAALRAHTSQTSALIETVGAEDYRLWWSTEAFAAAA